MSSNTCIICNKKTALTCDACSETCCKNCSFIIDEDTFEMHDMLPEKLKHKTFCSNCFNQGLDLELEKYHQILEKAKSVEFYTKEQSTETRLIRRIEKPVHIKRRGDRKEVLMCLAFLAAEKGYDILVDVNIKSEKIGTGKSHRSLVWNGTGVPADPNIRK